VSGLVDHDMFLDIYDFNSDDCTRSVFIHRCM